MTTLNEIKALTDSQNSYENLRRIQSESVFPQIPYSGILTTDLVFMNQFPKTKKDGSINLINIRRTLDIIDKQLRYQNSGYNNLTKNIKIRSWIEKQLNNSININDDYFYNCSITLEPKIKK